MLEFLLLLSALLAQLLPLPPWMQLTASACAIALALPGILAFKGGAPFVPTPMRKVRKMVEWAGVKQGNRVVDVGCGDGRFLLEAAGQGAVATGYERSVPTYALASIRTLGRRNITIAYADFWTQDYRDADVVFCFLLQETMQRFERVIWPQLKPGCRVVSHAFTMKGVVASRKEDGMAMYVKE